MSGPLEERLEDLKSEIIDEIVQIGRNVVESPPKSIEDWRLVRNTMCLINYMAFVFRKEKLMELNMMTEFATHKVLHPPQLKVIEVPAE